MPVSACSCRKSLLRPFRSGQFFGRLTLPLSKPAGFCTEFVRQSWKSSSSLGKLAVRLGFEPRQRPPKGLVLPLHHRTTAQKVTRFDSTSMRILLRQHSKVRVGFVVSCGLISPETQSRDVPLKTRLDVGSLFRASGQSFDMYQSASVVWLLCSHRYEKKNRSSGRVRRHSNGTRTIFENHASGREFASE